MFKDTRKISETGAWVHVKDGYRGAYLEGEDGQPDESKPIRIKMLGPDSDTLQRRARKRVASRLRASGGNIDLSKMSEDQIEAMLENNSSSLAENMADATLTWENMPNPDNLSELLAFSPEAAEDLYIRFPAIARQLKHEGGEIDDFLALASKS